jgi:hypothetical protein
VDARGRSALTELSSIITRSFFSWRRNELSAFTPSPTGVSSVVSCDALVGFRDMTRELSEKLKSVKLLPSPRLRGTGVSGAVLGGICNDVVLD